MTQPSLTLATVMPKVALLALGLTLWSSGNQAQASSTPQPYEIVRALSSLQDGMLAGRQEAIGVYNALLQKASAEMLASPADVWRDRRNVFAAASVIFSGGDGRLAGKVREQAIAAGLDDSLVELLESFAAGRLDAVRTLSAQSDFLGLPEGLGAVAAIAGARVWHVHDPARAIAYYDMARLLGTGGLVEEAAIRSQLGLTVAGGDMEKSELLMRQYFQRMSSSVFAGVAAAGFAEAIVALDYQNALPRLSELLDTAAAGPNAFSVELHRKLIRAAVQVKQYAVARLALKRLSDGGGADAKEDPAIQLLDIVAGLHESTQRELAARLAGIAREKLGEEDRHLYDATVKIAGTIERWPDEPDAGAARRPSKYRPVNRLPPPVTPAHPDLGGPAVRALDELDRVEQLIERM